MRDFARAPVDGHPFPHVLIDDYLEPELYRALASSFPDCPANSGPTGFTSFWGDPDYDRLIATNGAWRQLFERFHGQAFVDFALAQFADAFAEECFVDLSAATYVPFCESRHDKERPALSRAEHAPDELWVRVDIMQGRLGYKRAPHLDHRRRALSMLVYFCDADEAGLEGGDLLLHGAEGAAPVTIRPRHNRMVMFPCTSASVHSVSAIRALARPRNFVQVTLSSSADLWDAPAARGGMGAFAARARALLGRAATLR